MTPYERIMERVEVSPVTGCWNCRYATDRDGYAVITTDNVQSRVHRVIITGRSRAKGAV
jgi:hypothetical protein